MPETVEIQDGATITVEAEVLDVQPLDGGPPTDALANIVQFSESNVVQVDDPMTVAVLEREVDVVNTYWAAGLSAGDGNVLFYDAATGRAKGTADLIFNPTLKQLILGTGSQLLLPNGTPTVPSFAFSAQPKVGLYSSGTNILRFQTTAGGYYNFQIGDSGGACGLLTSTDFIVNALKLDVANQDVRLTRAGAGQLSLSTGSQLLLPDGTAVAPAVSFINDTTRGLWRHSAGWVGLGTGNGPSTNGIYVGGGLDHDIYVGQPGSAWNIFFGTSVGTPLGVNGASYLGFAQYDPTSSGIDTRLYRDAAGVLAQRNGANAQAFNIYNTYNATGPVYERLQTTWVGNTCYLQTQAGGGGTVRILDIGTSTGSWQFDGAGIFYPNADAARDLGKAAARVRAGFFGGAAATVPLTLKLHASQTANALEVQNSSGTPLASVTKDGCLLLPNGLATAPTIAQASNPDVGIFFFYDVDEEDDSIRASVNGVLKWVLNGADFGVYTPMLSLYDSAAALRFGADIVLSRVGAGLLRLSTGNQLQLPDGSVSIPSLAQASNPDVGFYFTTNMIRATVNNSLKWAMSSSDFGVFTPQLTIYDAAAKIQFGNPADVELSRKAADQLATPDSLIFTGAGKGLIFGAFYGNDIAYTTATMVQNQWYTVTDTDLVDGELNLVTGDGQGKLTVTEPGRYLINYSLTLECDVPNKHIEIAISINGTPVAPGMIHYHVATPNAEQAQGATAILALADNATVELAIRTTDAGTPTVIIDHVNLTLVQVGG